MSHAVARTVLVLIAWSLGAWLSPAGAACDLSEPETGTVAAVLDGETLQLSDGRIVRLIGAKAPSPPLGWRGEDPWPLVDEAKEALTQLASGAEVELKFGERRTDRYGHALAQVFVVSGATRLWLQEALVARGLARVYSFPDNRACVSDLLARESQARAKRLGVWGSSAYRIESAEDVERLGRLTHSYQLVEGTVAAVGEGGGRLYLNFAKDWRSDFTISVERKDLSAFTAAGIDLKGLAGSHVRVRGWVEWRNGPMIEASHPEQIEVLPSAPAPEETKPEPQPPRSLAPSLSEFCYRGVPPPGARARRPPNKGEVWESVDPPRAPSLPLMGRAARPKAEPGGVRMLERIRLNPDCIQRRRSSLRIPRARRDQ